MSQPKSAPKKKAPANAREMPLWLVCFDCYQQDTFTSDVTFDMVLRAPRVQTALGQCRKRIEELRESTTLFRGACRIYLRSAIKLPSVLERPLVLNWASATPRPNGHGIVECPMPEQDHEGVRLYSMRDGEPGECPLFLEFGDFSKGVVVEEPST